MQRMEKASLVEVRAGREAGEICRAACLDVGREDCYCSFPPLHIGNVHGCTGDFTHPSHVWHFEGREVAVPAPAAEAVVECPHCQTVFSTNTARTDKDVIVKSGVQVVPAP